MVKLLSSHDRPAQREKVMNQRTIHVKDSARGARQVDEESHRFKTNTIITVDDGTHLTA